MELCLLDQFAEMLRALDYWGHAMDRQYGHLRIWCHKHAGVFHCQSCLVCPIACWSIVCVQIGVIEDTENRERLSKLLRFYSSKSEDNLTSLEEYVKRMKEGQKQIYYMAADNVQVGCGVCDAAGLVMAFCVTLDWLISPWDQIYQPWCLA